MATQTGQPQSALNWFEIWWGAFFRPTRNTFTRISSDPKASLRWGIFWMAINALMAWFIGPLRPSFMGIASNLFGPQAVTGFLIIGAAAIPVLNVIFLLFTAAIAHALARLFNGRGTFRQLVYLWGVMPLPFTVLAGLVGFFPLLFSANREFFFSSAGMTIQIINLILLLGINLYLLYAELTAFAAVEKFGHGAGLGVLVLTALLIALAAVVLSFGLQALLINFSPY